MECISLFFNETYSALSASPSNGHVSIPVGLEGFVCFAKSSGRLPRPVAITTQSPETISCLSSEIFFILFVCIYYQVPAYFEDINEYLNIGLERYGAFFNVFPDHRNNAYRIVKMPGNSKHFDIERKAQHERTREYFFGRASGTCLETVLRIPNSPNGKKLNYHISCLSRETPHKRFRNFLIRPFGVFRIPGAYNHIAPPRKERHHFVEVLGTCRVIGIGKKTDIAFSLKHPTFYGSSLPSGFSGKNTDRGGCFCKPG